MAKFLVVVLLLVGAFGAGYYLGQRPVGTLQRTVKGLQDSDEAVRIASANSLFQQLTRLSLSKRRR